MSNPKYEKTNPLALAGLIAALVLMLAAAALGATTACAPKGGVASSGGGEGPTVDRSAETELTIELAFQGAKLSTAFAQDMAIDNEDGPGCLVLACSRGAIDTAHSAWRGALDLQADEYELKLPPTTIDATACVPLGIPAPDIDVDVDRQVRRVAGALEAGMTAVATTMCGTPEFEPERCAQLTAAAGALRAGSLIYAEVVAELQLEGEQGDGLVVVDLPPIPIPRPVDI